MRFQLEIGKIWQFVQRTPKQNIYNQNTFSDALCAKQRLSWCAVDAFSKSNKTPVPKPNYGVGAVVQRVERR